MGGGTLVVKPRSQSGHLKGRSLVWDLMWISSPLAHPNTCTQESGNGSSAHDDAATTLKQIRQVVLPRPMRKLAGAGGETLIIHCLYSLN